jgi:hypothetical protein
MASLRGHGLFIRSPDRRIALNGHHIVKAKLSDLLAELRVITIRCISDDNSARHIGGARFT